jgi:protein-disulfide isomerase
MWTWRTVTALAGALLLAPAAVTAQQEGAAARPLVEIDGQALSNDEVERPVALQVYQLEARAHALRRKAVTDAVTRHLLSREAARRGLTVEALLAQEVDAKVAPPTAQEVAVVVNDRIKSKPLQGEALEQLRASVETTMKTQRRAAQHEQYVESLRSQARIVVNLPDEPALRMTIPTAGEPALGPADAPVTLVEFGDFQCPFCRTAQRTLKTLKERYGDKLRIVHRDFPIDTRHRAARRAAEAARCAGEQNAYWPFHDALYQSQLAGGDAELTAIAEKLKLDTAALTACLESKRHVTTVQRGVVEGKALGVSVTPTFFVNGRPLVGAIPLEEFQAAIDRELTRRSAATAERTPKP